MAKTGRRFTSLEAQIDVLAHRVLQQLPKSGIGGAGVEFAVFGLKQGWASLFGALLLGLMLATRAWWPDHFFLARYDFLFLCAIAIQVGMLVFKLETLSEARVILVFHLVGTVMELFKTGAGSWTYPGEALFRLGGVPLFSGFMYAAVGSYMARINRIFDIRFERYPPLLATVVLGACIYINFFSHHFIVDFRYVLFAATVILFWRCTMRYRVLRGWHSMPILVAFFLVSLFIWLAENLSTLSRIWIYPNQSNGWVPVSPDKLGSWFLLMIISVVLVTLVHPPKSPDDDTAGVKSSH